MFLMRATRALKCSCWLEYTEKCQLFSTDVLKPAAMVEYCVAVQFDAIVEKCYWHQMHLVFEFACINGSILSCFDVLGTIVPN